jgi:hypothetical protein
VGAGRFVMENNNIRYLTPLEVEKITGRKLQTLANERYRGEGIEYYKIGASVRYKLSDVLAFMERHRIDPESRRAVEGGDVDPEARHESGA